MDENKSLYFLFAGENYYPRGGMEDYIDSFESLEDAKAFYDPMKYSWAEIATLENNKLKEIWYYRESPYHGEVKGWNESRRE